MCVCVWVILCICVCICMCKYVYLSIISLYIFVFLPSPSLFCISILLRVFIRCHLSLVRDTKLFTFCLWANTIYRFLSLSLSIRAIRKFFFQINVPTILKIYYWLSSFRNYTTKWVSSPWGDSERLIYKGLCLEEEIKKYLYIINFILILSLSLSP
jgi:hypothetical protein